jgi:hypothetical protein
MTVSIDRGIGVFVKSKGRYEERIEQLEMYLLPSL